MMTSTMPAPPRQGLTGWLLFFVVSLLLHLSALLFWPASSNSPTEQQGMTPLAVTLAGDSDASPAHAIDISPAVVTSKHRAVRPPPAPAEELATTPAAVVEQPAPVAAVTQETPPANLSGNSLRDIGNSQGIALDSTLASAEPDTDTINAQIRTRFADHFFYPLQAQRHGWEGEVLLAFHLTSDGTLSDIQVLRSSGYPQLDEAALTSLRAIGKVEFGNGTILHRTLELRMPVVYHLVQG